MKGISYNDNDVLVQTNKYFYYFFLLLVLTKNLSETALFVPYESVFLGGIGTGERIYRMKRCEYHN